MRSLSKNSTMILKNERGMALVLTLVLGFIGMLMILSLLYMVSNSTWMSGSKTRYQLALDAAHGGMNFFAKEIIPRGLQGTNLSAMGNYNALFTPAISDANFTTKLKTTGTYTTQDATITIPLPAPGPNMAVTTAIFNTSRGNSGTSANILESGGVVNNNSGTITPQHIPYFYQTETRAQSTINPKENARLSALYAY